MRILPLIGTVFMALVLTLTTALLPPTNPNLSESPAASAVSAGSSSKSEPSLPALEGSLAVAAAANPSEPALQDPGLDWQEIVPGISYREYHLPTPNNVYVARLDRSVKDRTLETAIAQGRLAYGRETVLNMVRRYEDALNYWGETVIDDTQSVARIPNWGTRNHIAVAINGFYFNPTTGYPIQGLVHSGWYARRFDECEFGTGGSGFALNLQGETFIGESVRHFLSAYTKDSSGNVISEVRTNQQLMKKLVPEPEVVEVMINGVNRTPAWHDEIILYTPQYDTYTPWYTSTEVLIQLSQPALISHTPEISTTISGGGTVYTEEISGTVSSITGTVVSVNIGMGQSAIPFDSVVLSAGQLISDTLIDNFQPGDQVSLQQVIFGCGDNPNYDWGNAYTSIGGAFFFLRNGDIYPFSDKAGASVRDPRTAIAYNDQFIYFIVVDGRDPLWSVGMTIEGLAYFARDTLGATYGIAEDGGGSSTMVVDEVVVNRPDCNNGLCKYKAFMPLVTTNSEAVSLLIDPLAATLLPSADPYARWVADAVLMTVVEPLTRSVTLAPGANVVTLRSSNVRVGPGLNYGSLGLIEGGVPGIVQAHPTGLDGVRATGLNWWFVTFLDEFSNPTLQGWISEAQLAVSGP